MIYQNLESFRSFEEAFIQEKLEKVPQDWYILITDIVGSTKAIAKGKYKEVNTAGGLAIIAVANCLGHFEFPFVCGGDGATILIPSQELEKVKEVLLDTKRVVKEIYDLDLRIGCVTVSELYAHGFQLEYGKLGVSKFYEQAILDGNGIDEAEYRIKRGGEKYLIHSNHTPAIKADFSGFTCRWQDIPSKYGETIALIIKVRESQKDDLRKKYSKILWQLKNILGGNLEDYHPLSIEHLKISTSWESIQREAKAMAKVRQGFSVLLNSLRIQMELWITKMAIAFKLPIKAYFYNLSKLKEYQIASSDYKKYDGTLKMVLAIDSQKRQQLEEYLENLYQSKEIYYGLHISDRAILTCLLHASSEHEVHFVDAADGGYALAAKQLKSQIG